MRRLTAFERNVQTHLQAIPPRKFDLWESTSKGQIVGYYYQSVDVAFESGNSPGWWYCLERDSEIHYVREDDIKIEPMEVN